MLRVTLVSLTNSYPDMMLTNRLPGPVLNRIPLLRGKFCEPLGSNHCSFVKSDKSFLEALQDLSAGTLIEHYLRQCHKILQSICCQDSHS